MSHLAVIIPALLRSPDDQFLLEQTVRRIPWQRDDELVLVSQGQKPSARLQTAAPRLRWTHFDTPRTKWGAIDIARKQVSSIASKIVLLDADDPIAEDSLRHIWKRIEGDDFDLLIGERTQITLRAKDELSPRSRAYIEIFSNALLLLLLGDLYSEAKSYPDIQSGFYVIRREILEIIELEYIGAYGGELNLYYELAKRHGRIERASIETRPSVVSSYDLKRIINDIFRLPFLADASPNDVEAAKAVAPLMYARYLERGEEPAYRREIETVLALRSAR